MCPMVTSPITSMRGVGKSTSSSKPILPICLQTSPWPNYNPNEKSDIKGKRHNSNGGFPNSKCKERGDNDII